eukprot:UN00206
MYNNCKEQKIKILPMHEVHKEMQPQNYYGSGGIKSKIKAGLFGVELFP